MHEYCAYVITGMEIFLCWQHVDTTASRLHVVCMVSQIVNTVEPQFKEISILSI